MNISVLIPAYQPDDRLVTLVRDLIAEHFNVLIVDDGSTFDRQYIFNNLEQTFHCTVIHHPNNQGKGSALKTGMRELLKHDEVSGCVMADADGQHLIEDIKHVAQTLDLHPDTMVLGCRDFNESSVPLKSQLGNKITRAITRVLIGQKVSDTQTGLRGLSKNSMAKMVDLPGEHYEFEMSMLLNAKKLNIPIHEVLIHTVYLNENIGSHFDPVKDSYLIYKQIFRFAIASSLSSIIDLGLFRILYHLLWLLNIRQSIMISTVIARAVSSMFNFSANRKTVFKNPGNLKEQLIGYYMLVFIIMMLSWLLVAYFDNILTIDIVWIKLVIDSFLFLLSFTVQKKLIFRKI
jgi:glycosyltransferase involved in cell wall biosynthesis